MWSNGLGISSRVLAGVKRADRPACKSRAAVKARTMSDTTLSVVVTVVEGGEALVRCLDALSRQENAPPLDVIVPYDDTIAEVGALAGRFPGFRFLSMGALIAGPKAPDAYVEHELFDRRRAVGLAAATGELVGMLEDRGAPREDWARAMVEVHASMDAAAIGGPVVNVAADAMSRALFVCDYGRHQPPLEEGDAEYLTDINICYRRTALESVRDLWRERYQETAVNWTLRDRGQRLFLSTRPVVLHRRGRAPLSKTLGERFQWGRVFGIQRGGRWSPPKAWAAAAAALVLPLLLLVRQTRQLAAKGARPGEIAGALPALMVIIPAWAFGEAIGYLQGAGKAR
jgi:hypothetical protein